MSFHNDANPRRSNHNRGRANTCPHASEEESHNSPNHERDEESAVVVPVPPTATVPSRRRAASASSIHPATVRALPFSLLHARTMMPPSLPTFAAPPTPSASSRRDCLLRVVAGRPVLLPLLALALVAPLSLHYAYHAVLPMEVKLKWMDISSDIEEYWYSDRHRPLVRLLSSLEEGGSSDRYYAASDASRVVGSSGISFNDDEEMVEGGGSGSGGGGGVVVPLLTLLWKRSNFGDYEDGGEASMILDNDNIIIHRGEGVEHNNIHMNDGNMGEDEGVPPSSNDSALRKTGAITDTTKKNTARHRLHHQKQQQQQQRRPAMAHVISLLGSHHPNHPRPSLPRASSSSSRRMKNNVHHHYYYDGYPKKWTFSRIARTILWIGLMIPILEVGIRDLLRRYRLLGSWLRRRRMRMMIRRQHQRLVLRSIRGGGGSGGENVHML